MYERSALLIFIPIGILLSGCIGEGLEEVDSEDRLVGKTFEFTDGGSGYLYEFDSVQLAEIRLEKDQFMNHFQVVVNWYDEEPHENMVQYINDPDQFTIKVSDGKNRNALGTSSNPIEGKGHAFVDFFGDVIDNQSRTGGSIYSVELHLDHAGDQYPRHMRSEPMKIDDIGNEFTWSLEYSYVHKDL